MTTFGYLLHTARTRAGLTQYRLAARSGVNIGTCNRLERDQRQPPSPAMVHQLAQALQLAPGEVDRLLVAAGFPPTERRRAACRRWRRWMKGEAA